MGDHVQTEKEDERKAYSVLGIDITNELGEAKQVVQQYQSCDLVEDLKIFNETLQVHIEM